MHAVTQLTHTPAITITMPRLNTPPPSPISEKKTSSKPSSTPPDFKLVYLSLLDNITASHAAIKTEIQLAENAIERASLRDAVLPKPPPGQIYVHKRTLEKSFEMVRESQAELRSLLDELARLRRQTTDGLLVEFEDLYTAGGRLVDEAKERRESRSLEH